MKIKSKLNQKISAFICANLWLIFLCFSINAQTLAPGAPGKDAQWATAGKQGVGTSASLESKVWFTLAEGVMTEVYYPDVTVANVHLLQFVVVNPKTKKVETEQTDAIHKIEVLSINRTKDISPIKEIGVYKNFRAPSSLSYKQINWSKSNDWAIEKSYVTNPDNNSIVMRVSFRSKNPDNELYIYYDPSLANSGMGDTGWSAGNSFLSTDGDKASALTCHYCKFGEMTNGFFGVNDGLNQLKENGKIIEMFSRAESGNVVQTAKITPAFNRGKKDNFTFELALGFGSDTNKAIKAAQDSLLKNYFKVLKEYQEGWIKYLKTLPIVDEKYQAQFNMAAMILKAHEDKTKRGANIASLTIPWGGDKNANENTVGGYHLIWSRDLYQVATAFMALGDKSAAIRALDFLFDVQQKADGSFPQNSFLDGKPFWGSLQMDEVAFPLILAYQLERNDKATWENHVKPAADFIVKNGPTTPQERWEERSGYSPSTIAAEIAGLVCAAEVARKNGDTESASLYLKTADEWQSNIEKWTATTNGKYGDGNYYLRITQRGNPNAGDKIDLGNGAGVFDEREIVDAGFLELVRLGIKSPDDPLIAKSVKVIDEVIRVQTPNGDAFYRYNHDGYGEMDDGRRWNFDGKYTGKGRLWALLSGERGQYELALADFYKSKLDTYLKENPNVFVDTNDNIVNKRRTAPALRLEAMSKFANEGLMIPEQIWDSPNVPKNADKQFVPELNFGEGTGSATPLAWSMAQFIRLAVNLQAGRNLDTPDVVYNRYVLRRVDDGGYDTSSTLGRKVTAKSIKELPKHNLDSLKLSTIKKDEVNQKTVKEANNKVEITTSCYGDWWDKNKEKVLKQSPIIVSCKDGIDLPIFVYSGKGENVEVVGDFTGWKPQKLILTRYQPYAPVEGDFLEFSRFYALENVASSARVEYKLIVDGKWITDPLNPNRVDNGVGGENSVFTMPDYKPTQYFDESVNFIAPPLEEIKINSKVFGERTVKVYVPMVPQRESDALPALYLQDGTDYVNRAKAIQIQQNLVKAGKVKPFIMVFVDYKDRTKEYWANDDYAKFLATEVVPAIDKQYNTIKKPRRTRNSRCESWRNYERSHGD